MLTRRGASCLLCGSGVTGESYRRLANWLATPCRPVRSTDVIASSQGHRQFVCGTVLHPTHPIRWHRGLAFCATCGYVAGHRARRLVDPCPGLPSPQGMQNMNRLIRGVLPHGTPSWPIDRPSGGRSIQLPARPPARPVSSDPPSEAQQRLRALRLRVLTRQSALQGRGSHPPLG